MLLILHVMLLLSSLTGSVFRVQGEGLGCRIILHVRLPLSSLTGEFVWCNQRCVGADPRPSSRPGPRRLLPYPCRHGPSSNDSAIHARSELGSGKSGNGWIPPSALVQINSGTNQCGFRPVPWYKSICTKKSTKGLGGMHPVPDSRNPNSVRAWYNRCSNRTP